MNVALSTIVLFILLIPGLLFRRFYYTEEFSKEYFKQTFFGTFFSAFAPSLILHIIWYYLCQFVGYPVKLHIVGNLLSGGEAQSALANIHIYSGRIVIYNISIAAAAIVLGFLSKKVVRHYKIDRKYKLFRFQNSWHYILKGEFFDFPRASFDLGKSTVEDIEFVYVDAIVDTNAGTILYEGILVDYELSSEAGLNLITLKNTSRKHFTTKNGDQENKAVNLNQLIEGHVVVIPFEHIKNINLSFYRIETEENQNGNKRYKVVLVE